MPAYLELLRPSTVGDYGGPFTCIALTGSDYDLLIVTAAISNILTVSTFSLLTH